MKITDSFRKYPTYDDSIRDYLQILKSNWFDSYNALFSKDARATETFLSGLRAGQKGGYATDKAYARKIHSLRERVKGLFSRGSFSPSYLKCLGREDEYRKIMGGDNEGKK